MAKTLSENFSMNLAHNVHLSENRLAKIVTVLKVDAPYEQGYHNKEGGLLPPSKTPVEETQVASTQEEEEEQARRQAEGV
jgi:hypothetical protein